MMEGRYDSGSIVEDVKALRGDVARVLLLLEGTTFTPGLVAEARQTSERVMTLMDREQEREARRAERSRSGAVALVAGAVLAVVYHMTLVYEVAHSLGIYGWLAVLMSAAAYLLVTVLLVFGVLAVMR